MKNPTTTPYGARLDEIHSEIEAVLGRSSNIFFSAYETDGDDLPINNLSEVVIAGDAIIIQPHDEFWGEGKDFKSEVLHNPTWLDLAVVADAMLLTTGDHHHTFLESVGESGVDSETGVKTYTFFMGS